LRAAQNARRAGDYEQAQAHLTACRELGPPKGFDLERVLLLVQQGMVSDDLVKYLHQCRQEHPEDDGLLLEALSRGHMQAYRLNDLLDCLDAGLQRRPDDREAYVRRGWAYERLEQTQQAQQAYRRAVELAPNNEDAQLHLAEMLLR